MHTTPNDSYNYHRPVHGGLNFVELESLGLRSEDVVDFSASINPLGASPRVLEAASSTNLAAYPDPECLALRQAISAELGLSTDGILVGNGSTELIHLLARAYLDPVEKPNRGAFLFTPTFGEYEAACRVQRVEPVSYSPLDREMVEGTFRWDIPAACDKMRELRPSLVFLCNPNNPTGVYLALEEVRAIAEAVQGISLLVLDEAYVSFVEERWDAMPLLSLRNVVLMRSMTKDYALTGLRLGYMLASEEVIKEVRRFQYTWSVNAPAQAAGIAAMTEKDHLRRGIDTVQDGKWFLLEAVTALGIMASPTSANFLLLRVGDATSLRRELLTRHGVCVRDCTSFGLPDYIRVGVRTMEDNRRLVEALTQVLAQRKIVA